MHNKETYSIPIPITFNKDQSLHYQLSKFLVITKVYSYYWMLLHARADPGELGEGGVPQLNNLLESLFGD